MSRKRKQHAASHTTRLRERLWARQSGRCHYCDCAMTLRNYHDRSHPLLQSDATIEHLVPRALGGTNAQCNLVAACRRCNAVGGRIDKWCLDTFGGRRLTRAEQHRSRRVA